MGGVAAAMEDGVDGGRGADNLGLAKPVAAGEEWLARRSAWMALKLMRKAAGRGRRCWHCTQIWRVGCQVGASVAGRGRGGARRDGGCGRAGVFAVGEWGIGSNCGGTTEGERGGSPLPSCGCPCPTTDALLPASPQPCCPVVATT